MKILSTSQIREADQFTIKNEPVSSIDLMERASEAFVEEFLRLFQHKHLVKIFCGTGNNGGDGLAIGRLLKQRGWQVYLYIIGSPDKGSPDFKANLDRSDLYAIIKSPADFPEIHEEEFVIDGLFGSGLARPIEGLAAELINYLNAAPGVRISIDIASGLYADQPTEPNATILRPHHTISFQVLKTAFLLPELHDYVGDWHLVDIGLDQGLISSLETPFYITEFSQVARLIPRRSRFDHKGDAGRLMLIAGSKGKMGAAILAARAALRSGLGLLTVHVPKVGGQVLQTAVPEAMVEEDADRNVFTAATSTLTVGVGPGIGTAKKTKEGFGKLIAASKEPLVIDADGINILAADPKLLKNLPKDSILTPHPGEFQRLVGGWENGFEKLNKLQSLCKKHKVNAVLKGAYSAVCASDGTIFFNPTGNPGMATAGSGDVLTGMVASLLAQNMKPIDALKLGVYLHGMAGDYGIRNRPLNCLIASDIIEAIPLAMERLLDD